MENLHAIGAKGPLSKRINYLKNLYTSNTSSASSVVSDSDMSSQFSTTGASSYISDFGSTVLTNENDKANNLQQQQQNSNISDIANLNDFIDVEMQSISEASSPASSITDEQYKMPHYMQSVRPLAGQA